jgi:hypothetical protein
VLRRFLILELLDFLQSGSHVVTYKKGGRVAPRG